MTQNYSRDINNVFERIKKHVVSDENSIAAFGVEDLNVTGS